jgi:hypothetical protein
MTLRNETPMKKYRGDIILGAALVALSLVFSAWHSQ